MAGAILDILKSPVTVVTVKSGGKVNGMSAAWVSQISYNPPMLAVAIAPERYTYQLIKESGKFVVNILASDQLKVGRHFGFTSGRDKNKFEGVEFETGKQGIPILKDTYAFLECEMTSVYPAGDHEVFFGKVIAHQVRPGKEALIFSAKDFF